VKMFDAGETRMIGLSYGKKNCDDMLSRFHLIPERHGRTDRFAISILISRVSMLTRDKNAVRSFIIVNSFISPARLTIFKIVLHSRSDL